VEGQTGQIKGRILVLNDKDRYYWSIQFEMAKKIMNHNFLIRVAGRQIPVAEPGCGITGCHASI
jgi:hypothetical protein